MYCVICSEAFDGPGEDEEFALCASHANLLGQGYVAMIAVANNEPTGDMALVTRDRAAQLGFELPDELSVFFCTPDVVEGLHAIANLIALNSAHVVH